MTVHLVAEKDLSRAQEERIQALLIAAFPQYRDIWSQKSFWGGPAEYRLWLEQDQTIIAHLGFAPRNIRVGEQEVLIAGVGAVTTHPNFQGRGMGQQLFAELQKILLTKTPVDFAFLECREAVIGFYEKAGFTLHRQIVYCFHPDKQVWIDDDGAKMLMPIHKPLEAWDKDGRVDLRGTPWQVLEFR
ncbi:MAG: GNAT family N-acetyltransferase [Trueperaceae bacterium]